MAAEARHEAGLRGVDLFLPDPVAPHRQTTRKNCVTDPTQLEANRYCMPPWLQAIISWNGDYRVCSTHRLGNLREQTFDEIYNGPTMREIRSRMLWRKTESCSWNCREEAYEAPELEIPPQEELFTIAPTSKA